MPKAFLCALSLAATAICARADWKITTATTYAGRRSINTEYFKGSLRRYDAASQRMVTVIDREKLRTYMWDLNRREYVVVTLSPARNLQKASHPAAPPPIMQIESETTDTGECGNLFGHAARHLITAEKCYRQENADSPRVLESESHRDGWYIDLPSLPREKHAAAVYTLVAGNQPPVIKTTHTGVPLSGLAVRERTASRNFFQGHASEPREWNLEVTELFEGALSADLFVPPPGFRHVLHFPNNYRPPFPDNLQLYWDWFVDWITSWFS